MRRKAVFIAVALSLTMCAVSDEEPTLRWLPSGLLDCRDAVTECAVHRLQLKEDEVPILYGLVRFHDDYFLAQEERFPHANDVWFGGCVDGGDQTALVTFCEGCRHALSKYFAAGGRLNEGD